MPTVNHGPPVGYQPAHHLRVLHETGEMFPVKQR